MTNATITGYASPRPLLLAEHARDARRAGDCALCPYGIRTGQRVAQLAGGELVHTWCAATASTNKRQAIRKVT
jgi:hypothetical protein